MDREIVETAIKTAGGTAVLAKKLRISSQAISQWRRIPVTRVLEIERITGISRLKLRPDIYGKPTNRAAA